MPDFGDSNQPLAVNECRLPGTDSVPLPSMVDLDDLQGRLDEIDSMLAELDRAPA